MSAHPKLTDEQIAFIRDIVGRRRAAVEIVRKFPTNAQIAEQLGCTERYVVKISTGQARIVPRETTPRVNIEELAAELMRK